MNPPPPLQPDSKSLYFDLQADFGITKHIGGFGATRELAALCGVRAETYLLEVGCGVGKTSCFLAQEYGCRVLAVDLAAPMVARAQARAAKRGLQAQVEFKVADAQHLPFDAAQFDVVLDESVMAFVPDKAQAVAEYRRVVKPGGAVGMNEVAWIKPPPPDLARYISDIMAGADFLSHAGWAALLENAGLTECQMRPHPFQARRQWRDEWQQMDWQESLQVWRRFLTQSFTNPAYWKFMQAVLRMPRQIFQFMDYIGYGLYVGRK